MSKPFCFTVLDISTGHLTAAERGDLATCSLPYQTLAGDYGGLLWVSEEISEPDYTPQDGINETLLAILRFAGSIGCEYVKFDADGATLRRFAMFEGEGDDETVIPPEGEFGVDVERELAGES